MSATDAETGGAPPRGEEPGGPGSRRPVSVPGGRGAVLRGALGVFAERGYDATSMSDLGAAAGVPRTELFEHFRSKRELFVAVVEQQNALFVGHVGARIMSDGPARERMRATIDAIFTFAESHPAAWSLLFRATPSGDAEVRATRREIHAGQVAAVAGLLARDAHDAGLDRDPAQMAAIVEMLIGALSGAVAWWSRTPGASRESVVDAAMELLWNGLGRPARARAVD